MGERQTNVGDEEEGGRYGVGSYVMGGGYGVSGSYDKAATSGALPQGRRLLFRHGRGGEDCCAGASCCEAAVVHVALALGPR